MGWIVAIVLAVILAINGCERSTPALATCRIESSTKRAIDPTIYSSVDMLIDCMKARGFDIDQRGLARSTEPDPIWNDPAVWSPWWLAALNAYPEPASQRKK